jgi:hypothetical protein
MMVAWGCESLTTINGEANQCTSTPGNTVTQSLILTLYSADLSTRLYQQQATCNIPFRPTTDTTCSGCRAEGCWRSPDGVCRNGRAHLCTFVLPSVSVPQTVVWTVAYPTLTYPSVNRNVGGAGGVLLQRIGSSSFADSLNVAVKYESAPTTGTNVVPNAIVRFTEVRAISPPNLGNFRCSAQSPVVRLDEDPLPGPDQSTAPCVDAYCIAFGQCLQPQARFWSAFTGNE